MNVGVRIKSSDFGGVIGKQPRARERALTMTTEKVIVDTKEYVPRITGDLAGSTGQSRPSVGKVIYSMPYARAQYYGLPNKTRTFHPKATKQWFEASKAVNKRVWRDVMALEYHRYFDGR